MALELRGPSTAALSASYARRAARDAPPVAVPRVTDFRAGELGNTLTVPTYDGSGVAVHPSVIHVPRGWNGYRYWMAMTPYPGADAEYENPSILRSQDGNTWAVPTGVTNPLVASPAGAAYNSDTHLVLSPDGVTLYLFYRDSNVGPAPLQDRLLVMSSTDGVSWSTPQVLVSTDVTAQRIVSPAVWYEQASDEWVMIGVDIVPATPVIKRATAPSPTGPWSSFAAVTVTGFPSGRKAWHLDAHEVDGTVLALVHDYGTLAGANGNLYLMSSADQGQTWTCSSRMLVADCYRSCFVPQITPTAGLALDVFAGRLNGTIRRTLATATHDFGPVLGPAGADPYVLGDTFNRADSATTLGRSDSGHTYTIGAGTLGISGNQAYAPSATNSTGTIDTGQTDGIASIKFAAFGAVGSRDQWLYFRYVDESNGFRVGVGAGVAGLILQRISSGTATQLGISYVASTNLLIDPSPGDVVTVVYRGAEITVLLNGAAVIRATDSGHATATKVGFRLRLADARFDNFNYRRI